MPTSKRKIVNGVKSRTPAGRRARRAQPPKIKTVPAGGEVVLYKPAGGQVQLDVRLDRDTVWLTQQQMSALFGRERSVVTKHLSNVFLEGELKRSSVCAKFAHTAQDGKTYLVEQYNLDVVISVGGVDSRIERRRTASCA